jgi:hypothetical protein
MAHQGIAFFDGRFVRAAYQVRLRFHGGSEFRGTSDIGSVVANWALAGYPQQAARSYLPG